jgi:uncharacterized membrane protein YozB (DUF420 family)
MYDFKSNEEIISSLFSLQQIKKKNVSSHKALILRHLHVQVYVLMYMYPEVGKSDDIKSVNNIFGSPVSA